MIPRVIKKTVDLNAAQKVDQLNGPLYQLETGGHKFEITVLKDGAAADISGSVTARFVRADGETVFFAGTLSGNVATVTLPQNCYVVNGRFGLVVFIAGSGVTSAVYALAGTVYRSTTDTVVDPEGDFPSVEDVMGIIDDCETATAAATAASAFVPNIIAPAYSQSSTYSVGDYVTKSGYLYRCTTEISTAETWDDGHWTAVTAGGQLIELSGETAGLRSGLNGAVRPDNVNNKFNLIQRGNIFPISLYEWSRGTIANSTGLDGNTNNIRIRSIYVPVIAGSAYKFVGSGYFQIYQYASDKSFIGRVSTSWASPPYTFTTNSSAGYLRFLLKKDSDGTGIFTDEDIANINLACYPVENALDSLLADAGTALDKSTGLESACNYSPLSVQENKSIATHGSVTILPANIASASGWCCLCVACEAGDVFTLTGTGGTDARLFAFASANGTLLFEANPSEVFSEITVTAPTGAAYFAFNANMTYDYAVVKGTIPKTEESRVPIAVSGAVRPDGPDNKYNLLGRGNVLPVSLYAWGRGAIGNSDGLDSGYNSIRLRSNYCAVTGGAEYKVVGSGYFMIHQYASDKSYIGRVSTSWTSPPYTFTANASAAYIRFILKKDAAGTGTFDDADIANLDLACYPKENALDGLLDTVDVLTNTDLFSKFAAKASGTSHDVTFTWNGAVCTANGTSTGTSSDPSRNTFYNSTLPSVLKKGRLYRAVVESESDDLSLVFRFRDSNSSDILSYDQTESFDVYVPKNAAKLAVRIDVKPGATVTNKSISVRLQAIDQAQDPFHLRCCTYNVGVYNYGYAPSSSHPVQATSLTISEMKEYFRTHNLDLFALQEGPIEITDSDLTTKTNANTAIYDYLYRYNVTACSSSYPNSPSLYSKYPISASGSGIMTGSRPYAWALININGIPVYVLSVHLALNLSQRESNYDEIAALVANYDHWIVLGDLNAGNGVGESGWDAQPEYTAILNRGWHTANGGWWGLYNTYCASSETATARYLDSVLASPNIDINTYEAPWLRQTMPGDHRPLMCDLTLYP